MEYGRILATRGVADEMEGSPEFAREVAAAFNRYQSKDWGDLSQVDKELNDLAVKTGERILAAYETSKGKIWIITEWDRSATTILFPIEY
ncbi:hypothetical protein [Thermoanaerobacterium butyriciformans]|uniref:Uncharacterized protein n=1 Tax=Thermoanaerobacterium butyriciformans TaxID=1702242 RepID=A0ABS4NBY2_9THEO|nr:hypothetical protein [Thermoanaerobacterium butyriciformans]MBP2071187.1 hypothetical protein [Thermoanaerobacterium butyriciformans]